MASWTTRGSYPLSQKRYRQNFITLQNGNVLAIGGNDTSGADSTSCWVYSGGNWSGTGSLNQARNQGYAILLNNGKVLMTGGIDSSSALTQCELYDPGTGLWTTTGSLSTARYGHRLALLPSGDVIAVGGDNVTACEIYSVSGGTWSGTGALPQAKRDFNLITIPSGDLMAISGQTTGFTMTAHCYLYSVSGTTWSTKADIGTAVGANAGFNPFAILYDSNTIMVAGGYTGSGVTTAVQMYNISGDSWSTTGSLTNGRMLHAICKRHSDGQVMVMGGRNFSTTVYTSCETFNGTSWSAAPSMTQAAFDFGYTQLLSGNQFIGAGLSTTSGSSSALGVSEEYLDPLSLTLSLSDSVSSSDSQSDSYGFIRSYLDGVTSADTLATALSAFKTLTDSINSNDSIMTHLSLIQKLLTESVTLSESVVFFTSMFLTESIVMTDEIFKLLPPKTFIESVEVQDWLALVKSDPANIWTSLQ